MWSASFRSITSRWQLAGWASSILERRRATFFAHSQDLQPAQEALVLAPPFRAGKRMVNDVADRLGASLIIDCYRRSAGRRAGTSGPTVASRPGREVKARFNRTSDRAKSAKGVGAMLKNESSKKSRRGGGRRLLPVVIGCDTGGISQPAWLPPTECLSRRRSSSVACESRQRDTGQPVRPPATVPAEWAIATAIHHMDMKDT